MEDECVASVQPSLTRIDPQPRPRPARPWLMAQTWVGIVAFQISRIHLHGLPAAPGLAQFPEVNLRTYVRHNGRPGVLFLSLHCSNRLAMAIAQPWFRLPYHYADVCLDTQADAVNFASRGPGGASFIARY